MHHLDWQLTRPPPSASHYLLSVRQPLSDAATFVHRDQSQGQGSFDEPVEPAPTVLPCHGGERTVVDVYVGYLRRKLNMPGLSTMLVTVRGAGYRFIDESELESPDPGNG